MELIGLHAKSRHNPSAETDTKRRAMTMALDCPRVLPVYHRRKHLGYVASIETFRGKWVQWISALDCASYNSAVAAISANQKIVSYFAKAHNTVTPQSFLVDMWPVAGYPEPGGYTGAANTAVQFTNATKGALVIGPTGSSNVSPKIRQLAGGFMTAADATNGAGVPHLAILYDRVLTYEANAIANATQTMTNTLPALRYISEGQPAMMAFMTVQTTFNAGVSNLTQWIYVNQSGLTKTLTLAGNFVYRFVANAVQPSTSFGAQQAATPLGNSSSGNSFFLPLATGDGVHTADTGVRSITSYTCSAANAGTFAFVLGFPLGYFGGWTALPQTSQLDFMQQKATGPIVYDGACLSLLAGFNAPHAYNLDGHLTMIWQ